MNGIRLSIATCCCLTLLCAGAFAQRGNAPTASQPAAKLLKAGEKAPGFKVDKPGRPEGSDELLRLSHYRWKKNVVLAFYPKAFTGGCTTQMCGYRDDYSDFKDANTEVIAISLDDQELADKFKIYHNLPFPVITDPWGDISKAYGVPVKEHKIGKITERVTFVIDKEGVIRHVFPKYNVKKDKDVLRDVIRKLNAEQADEASEDVKTETSTAPATRRASR